MKRNTKRGDWVKVGPPEGTLSTETVTVERSNAAHCGRCGEVFAVYLPVDAMVLLAGLKAFQAEHNQCEAAEIVA